MNFIWNKDTMNLQVLNDLCKHTMAEVLGIEFIEIGYNYLKASMPVRESSHQPYGLLHGGASAALAETIGSVASWMVIDTEKQVCVGLEINCNHIRSVRSGVVVGTVEPLHIGGSTHVWDIRIRDEREKLVCVGRLTVAILKKPVA